MDPQDFLNVARAFYSSPDEAHRRTAVSRAYYALYLTAHQVLETEGLPVTRRWGAHAEVRDFLRDAGDAEARAVADGLQDLSSDRVEADYRMTLLRFNSKTCALIVAKAQLLLATVSRWTPAAKGTIAANIKAARGW